MKPLDVPDSHYLRAAQGWLELENPQEANELQHIAAEQRSQPDVLAVRWHIYAHAKKWEACLDLATAITKLAPERSFGWVHRSYALHEVKRTQEAWDNLLAVAEKFPGEYLIAYNLACYAARLGRLGEAKTWLARALP